MTWLNYTLGRPQIVKADFAIVSASHRLAPIGDEILIKFRAA
jgi:hypothetical protein